MVDQKFKKMVILIAGGAGFIGSHLCDFLIKKDFTLICLDNLLTGSLNNIKHLLKHKKFCFIKKDINKNLNLDSKIDVIFHLASPASPNKNSSISYISLWKETFLANTLGTFNLLKLTKKNQAKFIYASSSEIYGNPKQHPQKEDYFGYVNPLSQRSIYDEAKRAGESITFFYSLKENIDVRIARIFNTYGPRMRIDDQRMIVNFIVQGLRNQPITVYGNGHQTRSLCYIDDMIAGLFKLMLSSLARNQVFNLGNPDERAVVEYAKLVKKITGSKSKISFLKLKPPDDPERRKPDISKAQRILNWQPKITLEDGLKKTVDYYKKIL